MDTNANPSGIRTPRTAVTGVPGVIARGPFHLALYTRRGVGLVFGKLTVTLKRAFRVDSNRRCHAFGGLADRQRKD